MYDPFSPDQPPQPPDDPASHQLMDFVDGKRGYPGWGANGFTNQVEGPYWINTLPSDGSSGILLNQDNAIRLSLLHSPSFQSEQETLYLSALDVSLERFQFDTQLFAGIDVGYEQGSRLRNPGGSSSTLTTTLDSNGERGISAQRMTATGGTLLVGIANSLMWQFSGPDSHTATSLVDFSIVQPLLRNAGRDRILESLTLAERNLLANIRQMERFRKGFYLEVATGRDAGQGPARAALSEIIIDSTVSGNAGGFIGLLQTQQTIRNQEANLAALRDNLSLFEEFYNNGERINKLQVAQTRQALYSAQSQLLTAKTNYQTTLDGFKVTLGLPPQLNVCIDDPMLQQFQLISDDLNELKAEVLLLRLSRLSPQIDELRGRISSDDENAKVVKPPVIIEECADLNNVEKLKLFMEQQEAERRKQDAFRRGEAVEGIEQEKIPCLPDDAEPTDWTPELEKTLRDVLEEVNLAHAVIRDMLVDEAGQEKPLLKQVRDDVAKYCRSKGIRKNDLRRLRDVLPRLRDPCASGPQAAYGGFDGKLFETDRIDEDFQRLLASYLRVKGNIQETAVYLERIRDSIEDIIKNGPEKSGEKELTLRICDEVMFTAPDALLDFYSHTIGLALVQARARAGCIRLLPVDVTAEEAIEVARQNRLDWMNARAALVDAWRNIEFTADDLESTLDVVFEGDIGNTGDNPLRFRDTNSALRAGLRFDAPLTRLAERNNYRESLITYQQARRRFYSYRDLVAAQLRNEIRNINLNRVNFELQREAILVAVEQVDQVRERLLAPPAAAVDGGAGQQLGPTTARDLVSAQNDLLNAQNSFMNFWVNYEVLRRSLDYDMGTFQLTPDGYWIDPGPIEAPLSYDREPTEALNELEAVAPADVQLVPPEQDAVLPPPE